MSGIVGLIVGGLGMGGVALIAVATHPEKVAIWASMIWGLIAKIWKGAEYKYVALDVASHVNEHLESSLRTQVDGIPSDKVVVKWANTSDAVLAHKPGTLIVRMRQHKDRISNILHASLAATPRLVAPTVRNDLTESQSRGIDLEFCRGLAESLGASAETVFRVDLLDPALDELSGLSAVLDRLERLRLGGLFAPVLIQELVKLGTANRTKPLPGLDRELEELIRFLYRIADKEPGKDVDLTFLRTHVKIQVLLVAKAARKRAGVRPFHWRAGRELSRGVETIYVMATERNISFAREVVAALDADRRLIKQRARSLKIDRAGERVPALIVPFEQNAGYDLGEHIRDLTDQALLSTGDEKEGTVIDVQENYALVDTDGLQVVVDLRDIDWGFTESCADAVSVGDDIRLRITKVDAAEAVVRGSRRACLPNPLKDHADEDIVGSTGTFTLAGHRTKQNGEPYATGRVRMEGAEVPAILTGNEVGWGAPPEWIRRYNVGDEIQVQLVSIERAKGQVQVSVKRLAHAKWEQVRARYPRDDKLEVEVLRVERGGAYCQVEPGLLGFVPEQEFLAAGLEYADFRENLRPGQRLYVVVRRVVAGKRQRLTLGLQAKHRT